jgi:hypothetical protein
VSELLPCTCPYGDDPYCPRHTPLPGEDRYCFSPCVTQLAGGECDCTRRIAREVVEAMKRAIDSFAPLAEGDTPGATPRSCGRRGRR